jgi:N-acetylglucosaminyl-diphospho-decaprenol L-rhamnosyltransferase
VSAGPALAIVVVTHDSAADLPATLGALGEQLGDGDEVVVVDNASSDASARVARDALPAATVIETGANLGFAIGCHVGVRASSAPLVLLLNPDCAPAPGCLDALRRTAGERPEWDVWQALVALPGGETVNTAGNVVHFLGFGWAGRLGEPVGAVDPAPAEAGFASGAALVVRREAWERTGGFDERYFMYGEDLDLSLRVRLAGGGVGVVPAARVEHVYAFTKGGYKWFYLERNRLWTVLGVYPGPLLALLAPALVAFELALLLAAWRGGWLGPKLRAQRAVVRELRQILDRRRAVQATRAIGAGEFAVHLSASLDSPNLAAAQSVPGAARLLRLYWRAVLAVLR